MSAPLEPPPDPPSRFPLYVLALAILVFLVAAPLAAARRFELCMAVETVVLFAGMFAVFYATLRDADARNAARASYLATLSEPAKPGVLELLLCVPSDARPALERAIAESRSGFSLTRGPLVALIESPAPCSAWLRVRPSSQIRGDAVAEAAEMMKSHMARDRAPADAGDYRGSPTLSRPGAGFAVVAVAVVAADARGWPETALRYDIGHALRKAIPNHPDGTHAARWIPEHADCAFDADGLARAFPMLSVPSVPETF